MSACCSDEGDKCALPVAAPPGVCPQCGQKGKTVSTLTVKSLVRDHTGVSAAGSYYYCRTPECEAVYFSRDGVFLKPDVKVRVGLKEQEDPVPLCYCFDYTRGDIIREIQQYGTSRIPERVKAEVQAGFCACEVKNPSGACCLGDITRAVQQAKRSNALLSRLPPQPGAPQPR